MARTKTALEVVAAVADHAGPLPPPPPGIYEDVPMGVYHRWDAVSNSRLTLLHRSPAHLRAAIDFPKPSTPAQRTGTMTHYAVLEPPVFQAQYVLAGQCSAMKKSDGTRCTNTGTALSKEEGWRCGVHPPFAVLPVEIITPDQHATCVGVAASFGRHTRANALLSGPGRNELSIVWVDPETGLTCKARLDRIAYRVGGTPHDAIVDLKSTVDARMRAFSVAIYKYGYHRQAALYVPGAQAVGFEGVRNYVIPAYEKERPYAVGVYNLDAGAMDAGEVEVRRLLRQYAECLNTNKWPATPSYSDEIEDISIPSWAFEMIDAGMEFGA